MATETTTESLGTNQDLKATLACTVGIMAYNEGANIGRLLDALLNQQLSDCAIREIIVVSSGSTDITEDVVREFAARDPRIKLLVQPHREGKASAVNLFLRQAQSDILVLESADTLPGPTTIQRLLEPFRDPEVGMTGGHPIPVNDSSTFLGFAAHLLWGLHHQVALTHPKLGELIAFRWIFQRIPYSSAVDEANIEPLVFGQDYQLRYVPDAVVYNRGPETVSDFLKQRRRIYAGHLRLKHEQGYVVATMSGLRILTAFLHCLRWDPRWCLWTLPVIALEIYGRFLGYLDYHYKRRDHAIWDIAVTTKRTL